ncbi:MAG: hypothetical protein K0Q51_580 [Rickettsiaceae bacterium]|jgi:hypothetical protein|nr:hypothetical protein [Rickettsiaceae bacterium]
MSYKLHVQPNKHLKLQPKTYPSCVLGAVEDIIGRIIDIDINKPIGKRIILAQLHTAAIMFKDFPKILATDKNTILSCATNIKTVFTSKAKTMLDKKLEFGENLHKSLNLCKEPTNLRDFNKLSPDLKGYLGCFVFDTLFNNFDPLHYVPKETVQFILKFENFMESFEQNIAGVISDMDMVIGTS